MTGKSTSVHNCNFTEILPGGAGVAIYSTASTIGTYTLDVGGTPSTSCKFLQCASGVRSFKQHTFSSFNEFEKVGTVIMASYAQNCNLGFYSNSMFHFNKGISITHSLGAEIVVQYNQFNTSNYLPMAPDMSYYGTSAIEVLNPSFGVSSIIISTNTIANSRTGIKLENIDKSSTSYNLIEQNIISWPLTYADLMNLSNRTHRGIIINDGFDLTCNFNSVLRPYYPTALNNAEVGKMYGFQTNILKQAFMGSNRFEYISSGINYRYVCMACTTACTEFYDFVRGIELGNVNEATPPFTGISVTLSTSSGRRSQDCFDLNLGSSTDRIFGWSTNSTNFFRLAVSTSNCQYPLNTNTTNVLIPILGAAHNCPPIPLSIERDSLLGPIVNDTIDYMDFYTQRRYMGLDFAYRILARDTSLLNIDPDTDTLYINFYNSYKNSNIGKFFYVETLINNQDFDIAEDSLYAISDTNLYEYNRKVTLSIFLDKIANGDTLEADDIDSLEVIAYECPMVGGMAVYEARAMLVIDVEDTCITGSPRIMNDKSNQNYRKPELIKLSPNPASNNVLIEITEITSSTVEIFDTMGSLVAKYNIHESNESTINVNNLKPSIYLFKVKTNDEIVRTFKVLINR